MGPNSSPDSDMWIQISKKGIILLLRQVASPTSGTQISQFEGKKGPANDRTVAAASYIQGHCCERARHCLGTRRSRHETLHHMPYELIEVYVSEFEAEPATKYLSRYFSL